MILRTFTDAKSTVTKYAGMLADGLARLGFRMVPDETVSSAVSQALDQCSQLVNPKRRSPRLAYARVARPKHPYAPNR